MPRQIAAPSKALAARRTVESFWRSITRPAVGRTVGHLRTVWVTGGKVGALDRREAIAWVLLRVSHILRGIRHLAERMRGVGEGGRINRFGARLVFHPGGRGGGDKLLLELSFCSNGGGGGGRILSVQDGGDVHGPPSRAES